MFKAIEVLNSLTVFHTLCKLSDCVLGLFSLRKVTEIQ